MSGEIRDGAGKEWRSQRRCCQPAAYLGGLASVAYADVLLNVCTLTKDTGIYTELIFWFMSPA